MLEADDARIVTHGLITDKDAVFEDVPLHRLDAVVVVPAGREAVFLSLVAFNVDELRAVLEFPELLARGERRAREIGFEAKYAVEFRRVTNRLVNRQPQ